MPSHSFHPLRPHLCRTAPPARRLVHQAVRDHALPSVSVSDVEVTRDFDFATVFVTALLADSSKEAVKALNEMAKEFRRELSKTHAHAPRAGVALQVRRFSRPRRADRSVVARQGLILLPFASAFSWWEKGKSDSMPAKKAYRDISGILLLDKPPGLSSNQALQRVRHPFQARKAGHTGSLDPMATGLLADLFRRSDQDRRVPARLAQGLRCRGPARHNDDDRRRRRRGGIDVRPVTEPDAAALDGAMCTFAWPHHSRRRLRTRPSSKAGWRWYKRARRGEDVQVPQREVEVHRLDLKRRENDRLNLHVECGSGTYVRSLARDLGERLGCGAHLDRAAACLGRSVPETGHVGLWSDCRRGPQLRSTTGLDWLLLPLEQGPEALPCVDGHSRSGRVARAGQNA